MDSPFYKQLSMNKDVYDKVLTAIRMYEIHKDIKSLDTMLTMFNIDPDIKTNIIKSSLTTIGN